MKADFSRPRSAAGFHFPHPDEQVRVFQDLDARWTRGPEGGNIPDQGVLWAKTTWKQVQAARLTGIMWYDACEIDAVVIDEGEIVGIAGAPWGPPGILVGPANETVMTAREAVEFYRRAKQQEVQS